MESQFTINTILFIVTLIVPGVIFKRFYFQGQFTKQFNDGLFADRLITSIFWGIFVQIITFLTYSRILGFTFTSIEVSLNQAYSKIADNKLPDFTSQHLIYLLGYLFSLVIIAASLGTILHKVIRLCKIDIHWPVFRFANHWNYYFRGDILSTKEFKLLKKGKWLSTTVDILIDDATEKNKMVTGFLTQYTISQKTGELEAIYLTSASKYSGTPRQLKAIPGDIVIIPYEKIIDMNIRYNLIANIQTSSSIKTKQIIFNIIGMVFLIGLPIIIALPWYLKIDVSVIKKILSILFGLLSWTFIIIVVSNPFQTKPNAKLTTRGYWTCFIISLIMILAFLICLNII